MIEIPHYKIEKELGAGGMSTVYLATHEILDRQVALKIMSPSFLIDGTFKECFINEGRIISKLNHPHIIHIYDIGISHDACYMAIELLEGDTLRHKIDSKILSIQDKQRVITQIASALNAAHSQNFIHRDIKPGNILFRKGGDAVLTDFGISKIQDTVGELTTLGFTAGTPSYMPPEFSMGEELDHRADIYSLGVVFYEMLTGKKPYSANSAAAISYAHVNSSIPLLEPSLAHYQQIIDRVLAKKPQDRFDSVMDFAKAIEMADISMAPTIIAKRDNSYNQTNVGVQQLESPAGATEKTGIDGSVNKENKNQLWMLVGGVSALVAVMSIVSFFVLSPTEDVVTIKNIADAPANRVEPLVTKLLVVPSSTDAISKVPKNSNTEDVTNSPKVEYDAHNIIENPITPTENPEVVTIENPILNEKKLTKEQTIIVSSLLDNCLLRASMTVKEMIRISKSESIIEDIKNLKVNSGRTKFITDTRRQIETSKQRIKTNIEIYYKNLTKLKIYQITLIHELLKNTEEGAPSKTMNQGVFDILNKHLEKSAKDKLTLLECKEDLIAYAKIITSTL